MTDDELRTFLQAEGLLGAEEIEIVVENTHRVRYTKSYIALRMD